jgi:hypothetical protein
MTPFIISLLYLLYRYFECVHLYRPIGCTYGTGEYYVIATNLLAQQPKVLGKLAEMEPKISGSIRNCSIVHTDELRDEIFIKWISRFQNK